MAEDEKKVGLGSDAAPEKDSTVTDPSEQVFDTKGIPAEPTDPSERSQMGRRVKRVEDSVNTLVSKLDSFVETLGRTQSYGTQYGNQYQEEEIDEDFVRKMTIYEKKKLDRQKNYEKNYVAKVRQLGSGDSDYKEIFDEMYNNFNAIHTGDPEIDADINWSKAQSSLLKRKLSPNKPNVKGERNTASTDLGVNATNDSSASQEVQLDDFAKEYVARTGMKQEKVQGALKNELRPGVSKR